MISFINPLMIRPLNLLQELHCEDQICKQVFKRVIWGPAVTFVYYLKRRNAVHKVVYASKSEEYEARTRTKSFNLCLKTWLINCKQREACRLRQDLGALCIVPLDGAIRPRTDRTRVNSSFRHWRHTLHVLIA